MDDKSRQSTRERLRLLFGGMIGAATTSIMWAVEHVVPGLLASCLVWLLAAACFIVASVVLRDRDGGES